MIEVSLLILSIFASFMWPRLTMFCVALTCLTVVPFWMAFLPVLGLVYGLPLTALLAVCGGFALYHGLRFTSIAS